MPISRDALAVPTEEGAVGARLTVELVAVVFALRVAIAGDALSAVAVVTFDGARGAARYGALALMGHLNRRAVGATGVVVGHPVGSTDGGEFAPAFTVLGLDALPVDASLSFGAFTVIGAPVVGHTLAIVGHVDVGAFGQAGVAVGVAVHAAHGIQDLGADAFVAYAATIDAPLPLIALHIGLTWHSAGAIGLGAALGDLGTGFIGAHRVADLLGCGALVGAALFILTASTVGLAVAGPVLGDALSVSAAHGPVKALLALELIAVVGALGVPVTRAPLNAAAVIAFDGAVGATAAVLT